MLKPGVFRHITCRNSVYPKATDLQRFPVPDEFVFWSTTFPGYAPPDYTAPQIQGQPWADPDVKCSDFSPQWNKHDGAVSRVSFNGQYEVQNNYPVNPIGRTGLRGRGLLGRWGPNHAADPVVTRWKRLGGGAIVTSQDTQKPILQMVAIQRSDNRMWAIPGGMVDAGEHVSATLKREFMEEALDSSESQQMIQDFFASGVEIYRGYVDDYRNTDNAWMETVAINFHDDTGEKVGSLKLSAGDDAANVRWMDINRKLKLHANHIDMVEKVAKRLNAHW